MFTKRSKIASPNHHISHLFKELIVFSGKSIPSLSQSKYAGALKSREDLHESIEVIVLSTFLNLSNFELGLLTSAISINLLSTATRCLRLSCVTSSVATQLLTYNVNFTTVDLRDLIESPYHVDD